MAKEVLFNADVTINSVNYSTQISSVELNFEREALDSTAFQGSGWMDNTAGIKSGSVTLNFRKDSDWSGMDSALWTIFDSSTGSTAMTVRKDSGAISTSNPEYQFNVLVSEHNINADVAGLSEGSVTFPIAGAVTRDTTP